MGHFEHQGMRSSWACLSAARGAHGEQFLPCQAGFVLKGVRHWFAGSWVGFEQHPLPRSCSWGAAAFDESVQAAGSNS